MAGSGTRSWFDRGTLRNPGPHLDRLPIGIDLSGISFAEGVRAAIACGVVLLVSVWLHSFPLMIVAFAANLTCFCDVGGLLGQRVKALLAFTILGALCWAGFGLLRNLPWPIVVPVAALAIFLCSMARVWGLAAQAVGNVLIVTIALALDAPLTLPEAGALGASFVIGGVWAVLLTLVIWRIHPNRPTARAVEQVWTALASLTADLRRIASGHLEPAAWDAHARAHRRATRATIEDARVFVAAAVRSRGPTSHPLQWAAVRLDAAETIFAALIAMSDVLESGSPALRDSGSQALRLLRPIVSLCGKGVHIGMDRFEPVLQRMEAIGIEAPPLAPLIGAIVEGLRVTIRASMAGDPPVAVPLPTLIVPPFLSRAFRTLRDNLTWRSAILRHAVRATVLTVPALAWSLVWWSPYSHWLTITVALTMQPYFATTWQRVLERVGGTLLGGLIGAAVAFLPETGLVKAVLLVPLCVIGFSVRQVSYGAYIACLTPLTVVLFDVAVPGHSDATIAAMRFGYTLVGGILALIACVVLWPSWDSRHLGREIGTALKAHARLADAIFAQVPDSRAVEQTRRDAGVANNNLEAALSRALQEPGHGRNRDVEAGLVVDAALRRLGGALVTFQHEAVDSALRGASGMDAWQRWVSVALDRLAAGQPVHEPPPAMPSDSTLDRLRRAVHTVETALAGRTAGPSTAEPRPMRQADGSPPRTEPMNGFATPSMEQEIDHGHHGSRQRDDTEREARSQGRRPT